MEKFNIDCENINILGNIYCKGNIIFTFDENIDESYDTIKYDINIKGDLWIICDNLFVLGDKRIKRLRNKTFLKKDVFGFNEQTEKSSLLEYNKTDFKLIKSDNVYIRCPNINISRNIIGYYSKFDELRNLKLRKIYERVQMSAVL